MTDTEIVDYLEKMLSWPHLNTASLKLSSKDAPDVWGWIEKIYRCGDGPWQANLREAVRAKKEQK